MNHESSPKTLSASALERMQLHMQLRGLYDINPFSFYNDPALWPKCHLLGDSQKIQQPISQPTVAALVHQANYNSAGGAILAPTVKPADAATQEGMDFSALGFQPALRGDLQADLSFAGHEQDHRRAGMDCYRSEINYGEKESANNWWSSNSGFEDSAASALHTDSMIQEYALQYI